MRLFNTTSKVTGKRSRSLLLCAIALPLLALGCSSDSPTEPTANPAPPPGGGGTTAFTITITANPASVPAGSLTPVALNITVRRADNGAAPANNTTLQLSTSAGNFTTAGTGPQTGAVALINGGAQVSLFAGAVELTAQVRAQLQSSIGTTNVAFTAPIEPDTFFIGSITPLTGSPDGGSRMRINGGGFFEPVRVFIGGQVAVVESVAPDLIVARTPQISLPVGETRSADVSVTVGLNTAESATDVLPGAFTYRRDGGGVQPQIFSLTPSSGPNEGGTTITIRGEGFSSPIQVLFGSGSAAAFNGIEATVLSVSSTQIMVTSPSATGFGQDNQNANVAVLVRNTNSGDATLLGNAFSYGTNVIITSLGPTAVSYVGGTLVTVSGQGFDEPVAVSAGGVGQSPISVTGTEIIFRASAVRVVDCQPVTADGSEASGPVGVTNIETGDGAVGPDFGYVGPPPPFITAVNPNTIAEAGGTAVTLTGGNFMDPVQVTINGALSNVSSVSDSEVVLNTPTIAGATFNTVGCDDNGDGEVGTRNVATSNNLSFSLRNVETGCTTEDVAVAFTVNPADTTCQNDVADIVPGTAPTAGFDFTVNGTTVAFNDQSLGAPTQWLWEFGDPGDNTSTLQNPSFAYGAPGMYTVRLTVTNDTGSSSATRLVEIVPAAPPSAAFDFTINGTTVAFTDQSLGGPTQWLWEFGDVGDSTSNAQNPSFAYGVPGMYTVRLTATNGNGSTSVTRLVDIP